MTRWTYRPRRHPFVNDHIIKGEYEVLRDGVLVGHINPIGGRRYVAKAYLTKDSWISTNTFPEALNYIRDTMGLHDRNPDVR